MNGKLLFSNDSRIQFIQITAARICLQAPPQNKKSMHSHSAFNKRSKHTIYTLLD